MVSLLLAAAAANACSAVCCPGAGSCTVLAGVVAACVAARAPARAAQAAWVWSCDRVWARCAGGTRVRCLHARLLVAARAPSPLPLVLLVVLVLLRSRLARLLLQLLALCLFLLPLLWLMHAAPVPLHVARPLVGQGPHMPMCEPFFSAGIYKVD